MAELHVSSVDNDKRVAAKVGDAVVISLPQNATTGFRWDPLSHTDNLTDEGRDITPAPSTTPGAGGGVVVFRYKVTKPGAATIVLKLWRGSEPDSATFKFTLNLDAVS